MAIDGFRTNSNKKSHPIHSKNGVNESDLKVGDDVTFSRIPVGQENAKKFNLQKLVAMDMTPQKRHHPHERLDEEARAEMKENNPDWKELKKKVDVAEFDEWVARDGSSGEARYHKIFDFSDFPVITTKPKDSPQYYSAINQVQKVLNDEARKQLGNNYGVVKNEYDRNFSIVTDSREYHEQFHWQGKF